MATLHLSNFPDELRNQLQQRARAHGRSLSAEVVSLLEQALSSASESQAELLADVRRRRTFRPAAVGAPDSTTWLREDRER